MTDLRATISTGRSDLGTVGFVVVWLALLTCGFAGLFAYATTPGETGRVLTHWPSGTGLYPAREQASLVVFVHPRCPCSTATISELDRMLPKLTRQPEVVVIFSRPENEDESWSRGKLWQQTERIRGSSLVHDPGGRITAAFGATTSGYCLLFEPDGRVTFRGGITAGRGHEGESVGGYALRQALQHGTQQAETFDTYGCPLVRPGELGTKR